MYVKICFLAAVLLSACAGKTEEPTPEPVTAFYAKGADISWITEMEDKGYKFYDTSGKETECTALLKGIGFNAVRFRIWVNPSSGYNTKEDVLKKCRRAQNMGMKIMIDFHYSDYWADPGKQYKPEAWKSYDVAGLASAVRSHTAEVLSYLKQNGIDVNWVQVGNEVTNGMLWEDCRVRDSEASNFARCFNSGSEAVKSVYPDAKVILHVDNAWKYETLEWFYSLMESAGVKYDVIGLSLYPSYWDSASKTYPDWKAKTSAATSNFRSIHSLVGKPVMLVEFGMPASLPEQSKGALQFLIDDTSGQDWFGGIFLWEPESEKSRNGYEYGAFADGKPTEALKPFNK